MSLKELKSACLVQTVARSRSDRVTSQQLVYFQSLLDEIRLMQHAVHKYKREFKALEMQSQSLYTPLSDEFAHPERYVQFDHFFL